MTTFTDWKSVPDRVAALLPQAFKLREAYEKLAAETGDIAGTLATWDVDSNVLVLYRPHAREEKLAGETCCVIRDSRAVQPDWAKEIVIKTAALPVVAPVFDAANTALGGATPLSNALVSALMMGGAGYGAGALAENLFPERYLQRGKLRRNLGLAGAALGVGLGANNAYATSKKMRQGFWRSWLTPNDTPVPLLPGSEKVGFAMNSGDEFGMHMPSLYAPTVSVPQFNNAAWRDAQMGMYTGNNMYTPPAYAAATTGLMSGLSTAQRSPIIRPVDVIRGIASAGVGLATANVAGRALSAMAGLTPLGQQKLQDMGLWGGMMHAIVPAMFSR
jgi:hypothetical protein